MTVDRTTSRSPQVSVQPSAVSGTDRTEKTTQTEPTPRQGANETALAPTTFKQVSGPIPHSDPLTKTPAQGSGQTGLERARPSKTGPENTAPQTKGPLPGHKGLQGNQPFDPFADPIPNNLPPPMVPLQVLQPLGVQQQPPPPPQLNQSLHLAQVHPTLQMAATGLLQANLGNQATFQRADQALQLLNNLIAPLAAKAALLAGLSQGGPLDANRLQAAQQLVGSQGFTNLPDNLKQLAAEAFQAAQGHAGFAANLQAVINDPKFTALDTKNLMNIGDPEKEAVLSQLKNYPDARAASNVQRLLQKGWFDQFGTADKQRALKVVAFASQHNGDRAIIDNSLNKFLSPGAPYAFAFANLGPLTLGDADASTGVFRFTNRVPADNQPLAQKAGEHVAVDTMAHEVNHLLNGDIVAKTAGYFYAEVGAFWTGFKARNNRAPTVAELRDRVVQVLTATDAPYDSIADSIKNPIDFSEIARYATHFFLPKGTQVNASNLVTQLQNNLDPQKANNAAPPGLRGNIDNH